MDNSVEVNDIILTKDGQQLRVLAVRRNGPDIQRVEGICDTDPSPMRVTVLKNNFQRVMKKSPWVIDPKTGKKVDRTTLQPWRKEVAKMIEGIEAQHMQSQRKILQLRMI